MKKVLFLILMAAGVQMMEAQSVEASIDKIEMLVGEQSHVTLKAVAKENAKVEFPQFKPMEYVTPGVEVLACQPQEDKMADNGYVERSMVFTLTSFDDTLYYIPPLTVKDSDVIAVNKKDLITEDKLKEIIQWLNDQFPGVKVVPMCATEGEGVDEVFGVL